MLGAIGGVIFFIEPRGSFQLSSLRDRISVAAYFVASAIIIFLGQALRSARDRAEREREFTQALHRYLDRMQRAAALGDVHEAALDTIVGLLGCDRASVLLFDDGGVMRFVAWRGLSDGYRRGAEGHSPWTADTRDPEPVCISDVGNAELDPALKRLIESEGIRSLCFIPLVASGRLIGKFMMYFGEPRSFSDDELGIARTIGLELAAGIERKLAEQKLRESEAQLREANRAKDEFLAMLSHELRNPIAAITSAAAILQRLDGLPSKAASAGAIVDRQAMHLARLVDDLLDISRVTRGKIGFENRLFPAADAIELACETARPAMDARRQTLRTTVVGDPPDLIGDLNRLAQAVANVLNNASRYSPEGAHIQLSLETEGDQAVVRVRDEGRGMSSDLIARIFDPFVQGPAERTGGAAGPPSGLGLGLTLARAIVEHHRGTIEAASGGAGRGSELTIRLPSFRPPSRSDARADAHPAPRPASMPRRILVVDDNADSASGLAELLGMEGHEVRTSPDGETALQAASEFRPEIVFLDIGLPGIDGYETARRLRAVPSFSQTRLVALTGYGQDEDRRRAEAAGFDSHVVKPLRASDLDRICGPEPGSGTRKQSPET